VGEAETRRSPADRPATDDPAGLLPLDDDRGRRLCGPRSDCRVFAPDGYQMPGIYRFQGNGSARSTSVTAGVDR